MPSILAVEDARGSKAGWTVSVSASPFVGNTPETNQKILKNATITFEMGKQVYNTAESDSGLLVIDGLYDTHEADGDIVIGTTGTEQIQHHLKILSQHSKVMEQQAQEWFLISFIVER